MRIKCIVRLMIHEYQIVITTAITNITTAHHMFNLISEQWDLFTHSTNSSYMGLLEKIPTQQCQQDQLYSSLGLGYLQIFWINHVSLMLSLFQHFSFF